MLGDEPAQAFESRALWPQTQYLPFRVRLAIDALAAALPARIAYLSAGRPNPPRDRSGTTYAALLASAARRLKMGWGTSYDAALGGATMTTQPAGTADRHRD